MIRINARPTRRLIMLSVAAMALSGCLGPTYGTGKSSGEQLFDDINGIVSFGPSDKPKIVYKERPELVTPQNTSVLPPPRASANTEARSEVVRVDPGDEIPVEVASRTGSGFSPADRRQAGFGRADPSVPLTPAQMKGGSEAFRDRIKASRQGEATRRRFLSEPPVEYRKPAASAPVDDPGVDESVKQARIQGASSGGFGSKLRSLLPF